MRHKLALLADGHLPTENMRELVELQEEAAERTAKATGDLSPMETSDREDAMADWFDDHGVPGGYELAPVLVAGGLDPAWLDEVSGRVPADLLGRCCAVARLHGRDRVAHEARSRTPCTASPGWSAPRSSTARWTGRPSR